MKMIYIRLLMISQFPLILSSHLLRINLSVYMAQDVHPLMSSFCGILIPVFISAFGQTTFRIVKISSHIIFQILSNTSTILSYNICYNGENLFDNSRQAGSADPMVF